jgi:putative membrane protein
MRDKRRANRRGEGDVWKGLAAGLIGGLVASWTMNRFQDVWMKLSAISEQSQGARDEQQGDGQNSGQGEQHAKDGEEQDDTTVKAASAISEGIFGHELTKSEKKIAGSAIHYSLGTGVGGLYGAVAELAPEVTIGGGLLFGTAFWLVVDEGAVPLLGLSKGPTEYPLSTHAYALASHFVYGLTAELVRRAVRDAL